MRRKWTCCFEIGNLTAATLLLERRKYIWSEGVECFHSSNRVAAVPMCQCVRAWTLKRLREHPIIPIQNQTITFVRSSFEDEWKNMEEHAMIYSRCTCGPAVSKMAISPLTSLIRFMKMTFEARVIKNAAILGPFIWQKYTYGTYVIFHRLLLICIYCMSWFYAWRFDRSQLWWRTVVPLHCLHLMRTQYKQYCIPLALDFATATRYHGFSRLSLLSFESARA